LPAAACACILTIDLVREGVAWFGQLGSTPFRQPTFVAPITVSYKLSDVSKLQLSDATLAKIFWHNPVAFFAQSGRLDLARGAVDQRRLWEGNSVLRGQTPVVDG